METGCITCMVVDDEIIARKGLIKQLRQFDGIAVVSEASSVTQFLSKLNETTPDVVFLDIMLRNQNVLNYFKQLKHMPLIAFVSAYREYAVEGFDLDVADYLLKPVTDSRLSRCVTRLIQLHRLKVNPENDILFLKSNGKMFRIKTQDILYVKSMENYVQVFLEDKRLVCKQTIGKLRTRLKHTGIIQVHRSYLVNTNKIESIAKLEITMHGARIPISRDNKKNIYKQILGST